MTASLFVWFQPWNIGLRNNWHLRVNATCWCGKALPGKHWWQSNCSLSLTEPMASRQWDRLMLTANFYSMTIAKVVNLFSLVATLYFGHGRGDKCHILWLMSPWTYLREHREPTAPRNFTTAARDGELIHQHQRAWQRECVSSWCQSFWQIGLLLWNASICFPDLLTAPGLQAQQVFKCFADGLGNKILKKKTWWYHHWMKLGSHVIQAQMGKSTSLLWKCPASQRLRNLLMPTFQLRDNAPSPHSWHPTGLLGCPTRAPRPLVVLTWLHFGFRSVRPVAVHLGMSWRWWNHNRNVQIINFWWGGGLLGKSWERFATGMRSRLTSLGRSNWVKCNCKIIPLPGSQAINTWMANLRGTFPKNLHPCCPKTKSYQALQSIEGNSPDYSVGGYGPRTPLESQSSMPQSV